MSTRRWAYGERHPFLHPLRTLVQEGNDVLDCGYPVHVFPDFFNALGPFIDEFKPDIVWAQLEGAREVLEIARCKGVKGLFFVHDAEFDPQELRAISDLGCQLVCSSGFLAGKVRAAVGSPAHVVYPPTELYFDTRGDPDGYITMINPHKVKGLDTFLEIARRLPGMDFLLQESWKLNDDAQTNLARRLADIPNVRFQRRVSDMREIYRKTRLLLVPSIWEEGFGMVALEAQSCQIPVIASARGGLPESVGDGGLLIRDYKNVDAWAAALEGILGDASTYTTLSQRALQHARSSDFSLSELARRFVAACAAPPVRSGVFKRVIRAVRQHMANMGSLLKMSAK